MGIGEYILAFRKKTKITQETLAKKAGLARSFITRLERGDFEGSSMSLATFIRLSKALKVPMYKLFQDIEFSENVELPPLGTYLRRTRKRSTKKSNS